MGVKDTRMQLASIDSAATFAALAEAVWRGVNAATNAVLNVSSANAASGAIYYA